MIDKNTIDEATVWAQEYLARNKIVIQEYYDRIDKGEPKDSIDIDIEIKERLAKMSIDDLTRHYLHSKGLNDNRTPTDDQFVNINKKIGLSPNTKEAVDEVIADREKEYIDHYQIDPKDPGMRFIVMQIIQDELQVKRLRQDLVASGLLKGVYSEKKDDTQKSIIDSINKLNKNVFDVTKYLQQWRDEKVKLEETKKDKKEKDEKSGLDFDALKKDFANHPGVIKAKEAQAPKVSEYVKMVESVDE
jgi:hypothetical protein